MNRLMMAFAAVGAAGFLIATPGCNSTGVGDPCTPEAELDPTFQGFVQGSTYVESKSFQCQTRVCLVNHFRGRVSCPNGQEATDKPFSSDTNGKGCVVNGDDNNKVTGKVGGDSCVPSQCKDRQAEAAVYCSCRCANADGKTDDGANYCACPDGFSCEQLVPPTGLGNEGLTGGYCIKANTKYDAANNCQTKLQPADACKLAGD